MKSYTLFRIPMPAARLFNRYTTQVTCDWAIEQMPQDGDNTSFLELSPEIIPKGWYAHRFPDEAILLTKQKELPNIGSMEGYAYGEQIGVSVSKANFLPEEWVARQGFDGKDALTRSWEWGVMDGYRILRIEHETPAAPQHTEFIFVDNRVYTFFYYPLELFKQENNRQIFEQIVRKFILHENCAKAEIPNTELDTNLDTENGIAVIRWWDGKKQQNVEPQLPYYSATNFEGCSESTKKTLRHIQEAAIPQ